MNAMNVTSEYMLTSDKIQNWIGRRVHLDEYIPEDGQLKPRQ